jgi:hypothetical protein
MTGGAVENSYLRNQVGGEGIFSSKKVSSASGFILGNETD